MQQKKFFSVHAYMKKYIISVFVALCFACASCNVKGVKEKSCDHDIISLYVSNVYDGASVVGVDTISRQGVKVLFDVDLRYLDGRHESLIVVLDKSAGGDSLFVYDDQGGECMLKD